MEFVSAGVTGGVEHLLDHWEKGHYACARCDRPLYSSATKWKGPCPWPSFRQALASDSLEEVKCTAYNGYTCDVREVYCGGCELFLGHMFEDAVAKGDVSPECTGWRH